MGADYFAIIQCPIQRRLTPDVFCRRLKLRTQLDGLEARRAEIEQMTGKRLEDTQIERGGVNNPGESATYAEMRTLADELSDIPECPSCAVSGGKPLGCYRYIKYPIDAGAEQAMLDYFVAMLDEPTATDLIGRDATGKRMTAADLLYDIAIAHAPARTTWHDYRGGAAGSPVFAERKEPATRTVQSRGLTLDSAHVLHAAFSPIDGKPALQLLAHFFVGFTRWAQAHGRTSRSLDEFSELAEMLAAAMQLAKSAAPVDVIVEA